ncbi:hypothetical protein AB0I85_15180 [Micromonospora echinofusca]|uniref:hypothetical protein n=1 Tax=Micromonospora echinofusca TaxID=47858 RepID=UPI0033E6283A
MVSVKLCVEIAALPAQMKMERIESSACRLRPIGSTSAAADVRTVTVSGTRKLIGFAKVGTWYQRGEKT